MSNVTQLATRPTSSVRTSALTAMAARLNVEPDKLLASLTATAFKGAKPEEMLALVVVANQYGLNPFLKQIYAFPAKGGGIVPIVGIDGWTTIVNSNPAFDGVEFEFADDGEGKPLSVTCIMHVKNRSHPIKVTEYYSECKRNTEPWNMMPRRMLRHKAFIQCGRVAFSLGGIYEEDEAKDVIDVQATIASDTPAAREPRAASLAKRLGTKPAEIADDVLDAAENEHGDAGDASVVQPGEGGDSSTEQPPVTDAQIGTYAAFYENTANWCSDKMDPVAFTSMMSAINLNHPVKADTRHGTDARRAVLAALRDGQLSPDGKILK